MVNQLTEKLIASLPTHYRLAIYGYYIDADQLRDIKVKAWNWLKANPDCSQDQLMNKLELMLEPFRLE